MSLIPTDAGVRIRTQSDQILQPVLPVADLPADLTDLTSGKLFSARIQEVLPDNTYKALVAGRSLTLALPEGAKAGDTLELVVVDRSGRTVLAKLATPETADSATGAQQFTKLSPGAQLIGSLLARDGDAPAAAALNRGQPLLASGPQSAADILPQLAKAISHSGMFYEAHQVQWAMGKRALAELLGEPQAAHSKPDVLAAYRQDGADTGNSQLQTAKTAGNSGSVLLLQSIFGADSDSAKAAPVATTANPATAVPEELRPLVQQQLEAAATQRMAWHGEVWPGQPLEWEIERDGHGSAPADNDDPTWVTTLRLVTPRLGQIDARLHLTTGGVQISIATPHGATAGDLRSAGPELQRALDAAGVPLLSLKVKHDSGS